MLKFDDHPNPDLCNQVKAVKFLEELWSHSLHLAAIRSLSEKGPIIKAGYQCLHFCHTLEEIFA